MARIEHAHPVGRRHPTVTLIGCAIAVAVGGSATAQAPSSPPAAEIFVGRVDVDVVNVEAFVTDRQGQPVTDLVAADFTVLEDGREVEITNFFTVSWNERLFGPRAESPGPVPVPAEQRLNLVAFVDLSRMFPEERGRAVEALRGVLEDRVVAGDRVMVAAYARSLEVIQPFTSDRFAVEDALDGLLAKNPLGAQTEAQRRQAMLSIAMLAQTSLSSAQSGDTQGAEATYSSAHQMIRSYIEQTEAELRRQTQALERMVGAMNGLPGRKALLYVGSGLPQRPGEELYRQFQELFAGIGPGGSVDSAALIDPTIEVLGSDQSRLYDRVTRAANANQVTLYTLDAAGAAPRSGLGADADEMSSGATAGGRTILDAVRTQNLQEPMLALAHETGGTAVVGTFNFRDGLAKLADDFESYYSLGYRSRAEGDGKYHTIEVKVRRPGLAVRHRGGYRSLPAEERVAQRTLSSLLMEMESNPLGVEVDLLEPRRHDDRRLVHLPVLVRVPLSQVTLIPRPSGDRREGRLQFYIVVRDEEGEVSDLHRHSYPVSVAEADYPTVVAQQLGYVATLAVRKGKPTVAVGVWDELSGSESFVHRKTDLTVPPAAPSSPSQRP